MVHFSRSKLIRVTPLFKDNVCENSDFSDWDSSSSAESINLNVENEVPPRVKRIRIQQFMNTVDEYSEAEFRKHFRLSRGTANVCIGRFVCRIV